ncbi:MAG: hypothetical protein R3B83_02645 [Nitrospirales bacterium]|nr:hypothetical protein [Nitrospirales bacterium]
MTISPPGKVRTKETRVDQSGSRTEQTATQAASGFDTIGEQKLMFSYIARPYEQLDEPGPARDYFEKKLALINQGTSKSPSPAMLTEKPIVLNLHQGARPSTRSAEAGHGVSPAIMEHANLEYSLWHQREPLVIEARGRGDDQRPST